MKMKRFGLVLIFAFVVVAGLFAFNGKEYPDSIQPKKFIINAGIGFGSYEGNLTVPPLSLIVDYPLPLGGLPFTVGGMFGFTMSRYEYGNNSNTWTGIAIAGRFGYHPNFGVKNLDVYANLSLGYYIFTVEYKTRYNSWKADASAFYLGINLGARYFFNEKFGAFLEVGYSNLSYATVGVSVKL